MTSWLRAPALAPIVRCTATVHETDIEGMLAYFGSVQMWHLYAPAKSGTGLLGRVLRLGLLHGLHGFEACGDD